MNIVNHYMRIKENTSHHILSGKFDSDILFKLIQYDKNYILKLKNDTDFLYGSSINKYFDFAPESDPFLIALSGKTENISEYGNTKLEHKEKNIINIPDEISEIIKNCQFFILQELIYNEIGNNGFNKHDTTMTTGKSLITNKSSKNIKSKNTNINNIYSNSSYNTYNNIHGVENFNNLNLTKNKSNGKKINSLKPLNDQTNNNYNNLSGIFGVKNLLNFNTSNKNKNSVKLENGILLHHEKNSFYLENNLGQNNILTTDNKNIDNLLNDSKLTKKTDISNIEINQRDLFLNSKIEKFDKYDENNFKKISDINLTENKIPSSDISGISHKTKTPNNNMNKIIIKEKIFIDDEQKKYHFSNYENIENDEKNVLISKESLTKVSMELEKLRNDILESHYIENIEKLTAKPNNKFNSNINNLEITKNNLINNNKKIKIPTGSNIKIKNAENKNNFNNLQTKDKELPLEEELINNIDKNLLEINNNINLNKNKIYKTKSNISINETSELENSNLENLEKSNEKSKIYKKNEITNNIYDKYPDISPKQIQNRTYSIKNIQVENKINEENYTSNSNRDKESNLEIETKSNVNIETESNNNEKIYNIEEKDSEKILTHKLMKKMDYALLSSNEFSVKDENIPNFDNGIENEINFENNFKLNEENKDKILSKEFLKINENYECEEDNNINKSDNNFDMIIEKKTSKFLDEDNLSSKLIEKKTLTELDINSLYENENKLFSYRSRKDSTRNLNKKDSSNEINIENKNKENNLINISETPVDKIINLEEKNILVNTENEENIINNENLIEIKFCDYSLEKLKNIYKEYMQKIDNEQKIIFNINENFENYLTGGFPKFIEITNNKNIISLSACFYDNNFSTGLRLVISNFSCIDSEKYSENAEKIINFIQANFPHNEIYIELFYGIREEKFYVNEKLRDVFSKQLKFKWITLENTGTERIVKYRLTNIEFNLEEILNNPKYFKIDPKKKYCKFLNSLIDIKINTTFSFKEQVLLNPNSDQCITSPREFSKEETDVNIFPSIYLLCDLIYINNFYVNNENLKLFSNEKTRVIYF